jgi:transcriptional regulator with XRE-family HTH domain
VSLTLLLALPLAAAGKLEREMAATTLSARSTMSRIERGKRNVALRNIEAIAIAFNRRPRAFLFSMAPIFHRSMFDVRRHDFSPFQIVGRVHSISEGLLFGSNFR